MLAAIAPLTAFGACTRSDVDYYLARGFTREQVVGLCTGKPAAGNAAPAALPQEASPKPGDAAGSDLPAETAQEKPKEPESATAHTKRLTGATEGGLEDFFGSAIDGYDIHLSEKALHYTRRTCIEYGPYNQFGIKTEACPDVRYTVERSGLTVKSVKQALLILGNLEATVSGRIERKIVDLDRYEPPLREAIQAHLEKGPETVIPIRDGIPEARLQAALQKLPL